MKKVNLIALAIIAGSLTACGSGGGDSAGGVSGAVDDALKSCGGTYEECAGENPQVWVWDEENYDSFAHQQMAITLEKSHISYLQSFEDHTDRIPNSPDRTELELVDLWAKYYVEKMDSFIVQVKPVIVNIYNDYGASTEPDRYLANALVEVESIRQRFIEQYNMFIEPMFYPYPDASERLVSLDLLTPYLSQLDTISVEITMEIN